MGVLRAEAGNIGSNYSMLIFVNRSLWSSSQDQVYFIGGGAAGELWRHQQRSPSWPSSWILPRIRNQVKTARNGNVLCFTWKITHKYALCMILATRFTFIVQISWKNRYFHSKIAWPPATYDVISRNHSNSPSLNLSQNIREGWTNSYWKRQVLMFYPLGKDSDKPYGGWHPPRPPSLYVRGLNVRSVPTYPSLNSIFEARTSLQKRRTGY